MKTLSPSSILQTETGAGTLTYSLPTEPSHPEIAKVFDFVEKQTQKFKSRRQIFNELNQFQIKDWYLSQTTLAEVFLRLTHGKGLNIDNNKLDNSILKKELQQLNVVFQFPSIKNLQNSELDNFYTFNNRKELKKVLLGFVKILPISTLKDLREMIIQTFAEKLPEISTDSFDFLKADVRVIAAQEGELRVFEFLPEITITTKIGFKNLYDDERSQMQGEIVSLKMEIDRLKDALKKQQQIEFMLPNENGDNVIETDYQSHENLAELQQKEEEEEGETKY